MVRTHKRDIPACTKGKKGETEIVIIIIKEKKKGK